MQPTQDVYSAAQRVVEQVDFRTIRSAMIMSGWKWGIGAEAHIPTLAELRTSATRLVIEALSSKTSFRHYGSGGFRVDCVDNYIRLSFELRDSGWYQHNVT